jgi:ABC-2 type transport system permease protein
VGGFFSVAGAVAGRQIYKYFANPAFMAPALFPLFFFVAFAGGLTRVGDVPGFDYPAGYIAFQYVWALLQAVAMGGAFTGFSIAGDFENGFAKRLMLAASNRSGIIFGYTIASLVRVTTTGTLVTAIALLAGIPISGGFDLFGLIALRVGGGDADAHPTGGADDPDAHLPGFVPGPGLRTAEPFAGLDRDRRPPEPLYDHPRCRPRFPRR